MKKSLSVLLLLLPLASHGFSLGEPQLLTQPNEPIVLRLPVYELDVDHYSTLKGHIRHRSEVLEGLRYTVRKLDDVYIMTFYANNKVKPDMILDVSVTYRLDNERTTYERPVAAAVENTADDEPKTQSTDAVVESEVIETISQPAGNGWYPPKQAPANDLIRALFD